MLLIRPLTSADIPDALRLCRASGWNQVERDWTHFLALSPQSCRAAESNGVVVGTVTTVHYETGGFAWIGMMLVDPAHRGQGIGKALLSEALQLLSDVPTVWLDATPAGHALYRKLGFEDDSQLARMLCVSPLTETDAPVPAPFELTPAVAALDRQVFGADRNFHLRWLDTGYSSNDGGYVLSRGGELFHHVGPLVAPDPATAERLLRACLPNAAPGKPVIVDASPDPEWRARLARLGFVEQRPFTRMRKGPAGSKRPHPWEFAILGPEFG